MKISYNWLQDYFESGDMPSVESLVDRFTFRIFEVDDVEKVDDDTVIDLDILPNRAHDCLSHRGIAREVATLFDIKMQNDPLTQDLPSMPESELISVEVDADSSCSQYHTAVITGVKIGESPKWLKERLEAIGQRSINNIVDATNYVMYGLGQPLHAFDLHKLSEKGGKYKLGVRLAKVGEKITILGGEEKELENWMDRHNYLNIDQFRAKMSQAKNENGAHYERVQFMRYFGEKESTL